MIILTTSTSAQTFSCIPRGTFDGLTIMDEQTNVAQSITIDAQTYGDYVSSVTATFNLIEGRFYSLTLLNGTDVMYKDKIFCTDKSIVNVSVNDGQYVSNATANTFIVYE